MKKSFKEICLAVVLFFVVGIYPIMAFCWCRALWKCNNKSDAKRFAVAGVIGTFGFLGLIGICFIPSPWKELSSLAVGAVLVVGYYKLSHLVTAHLAKKPYRLLFGGPCK